MRKAKYFTLLLVLALTSCLTGCSKSGDKDSPSSWGYDIVVTYDALGGVINSREVRTTYYLENSYLYEPSGSSGMLVEPKKEGCILAGWYTAKTDVTDSEGNVIGYEFQEEDRWNFDLDRAQEDMTLYARWIKQGTVQYYDADTGELLFSKKITADSPVQALSAAVLSMHTPEGAALEGYYADAECTTPYDFSAYEHVDLVTDDLVVYEQLAEEFPDVLIPYTASEDDEEDTSIYRFLHDDGYDIADVDEDRLADFFARYDEIIEDAIDAYEVNTADKNLFLKFTDGSTVTVRSVEDLKSGSSYMLSADVATYIFEADLDFTGIDLTVAEDFSGTLEGNGHTISNLTLSYTGSKKDKGKMNYGLFKTMTDAVISDLTFENITVSVNPRLGVTLYAGLLAGSAENCTVTNCTFRSITVTTSDDYTSGSATVYLGDLFGTSENCEVEGCTAQDVIVKTEQAAGENLLLDVQ